MPDGKPGDPIPDGSETAKAMGELFGVEVQQSGQGATPQTDPNAATRQKAREDLERQASEADTRAVEADARARAARDTYEAQRREDAASAARTRAQDPDLTREILVDDDLLSYESVLHTGRLAKAADEADQAADAAKAEAMRLREMVLNFPDYGDARGYEGPRDDPLEDIGEEAVNRSILGVQFGEMPERQPAVQSGPRPYFFRRAGGAATAGLGAILLFQSFQSLPTIPLQPNTTATQPPSPGAAPSVAASSAQPSLPPVTVLPATGSALAFVDFKRRSGSCFAAEFPAAFEVGAVDGVFTLNQLGVEHVSTGTIDAVTGEFEATAPDQSYEGATSGTRIRATYTDTTDNCNDVYDVVGHLTRPLFGRYNSVSGRFEFFNPQTGLSGLGLLDIAAGQPVHVIVGSTGTPDMTTQLPIRVVGSSGDDTFWDFTIDGDPSAVCRDATGCSADAPTPRLAAWDNAAQPLLIIATGAGNDVLAVHAPHGVPAAPEPTSPPSAPPTVAPSVAPSPAASAPPSTPSASGGGGFNGPLAGLGLFFVLAGLTVFAAPQLIGGPGGAKPAPPPRPAGVTPDEAKAIGDILGGTPPPPQPSPSDIAAAYQGARSGVMPEDAQALGDILDNRPPPTATPPPTGGGVTPDEAKAIGDILGNNPPPPPPSPSDIAAGYQGTPSGVTPDEAKALGDILDNRPPPAATPPPPPSPTPAPTGGVTPDEAKAIGDILDNRPPPPPTPPPAGGTGPGGGPPGGTPPAPEGPATPR